MKKFRRGIYYFTIALLACAAMTALIGSAAGEEFIVRGKSQTGLSYMTGGVGLEEREAMKKQATDYNLWLEFTTAAGNYLSGVEVQVTDAQGALVLEGKSAGPWFMVFLPAGKYKVVASACQKKIVAEVSVPIEKKFTLTWK